MANYDLSNLALKAVCPGNAILLDDKGLPSVMVRIPKFKISDVIAGGSDSIHPAFRVNGIEVPEIYISKFQNVVFNGRAYSLPGEDPAVSMNFDAARTYCEAKGAGWHLMTNAEWAAIALWCRKNALMPKGNNNYGRDTTESGIVAIPTSDQNGAAYTGTTIGRVAAGTGPITWSHNAQLNGIWDLNGNVWEWVGGYRTVDGEIQILADNNAADSDNPQNNGSAMWRAIMPNGSLVDPTTGGTLKWDYSSAAPTGSSSGAFRLNTAIENPAADDGPYGSNSFSALTAKAGVDVPEILKALALFPADSGDHGGDNMTMRNRGERLAFRGGYWHGGSHAGVFSLSGIPRSNVLTSIGFRSAFIPGI